LYSKYAQELIRIKGVREEDTISEQDEFWALQRELVQDLRGQLGEGTPYTFEELYRTPPGELYAEIAALYENSYLAAKRNLDLAKAASDAGERQKLTRSAIARIKFPWRVAAYWLNDMKRKEVQMDAARRMAPSTSSAMLSFRHSV